MSLNALVLGATGLCGSGFLKYAEQSTSFGKVFTITRRELPNPVSNKVDPIVEKNTLEWPKAVPEGIRVIFSGLATTRAVGGFENQYKIDHDLNIELAKTAKEKGCSTCVIVSSGGANDNSRIPYLKLKGDIERDIIALGFEKTIILRPGILLGDRENNHKGFGNSLAVRIGNLFYRSRFQGLIGHPVYGDEVAKVGVKLALDDTKLEKVQIIESAEILRLAED